MENATVTRKHAPHLLLIPGESTEQVSSAELISDLKLDTLLPDECNRFLLMKPNENGFLSRPCSGW